MTTTIMGEVIPALRYSIGSGSGLVTGGVLFGDLLGGGGVTGSGVGDTSSSSGISVYLLTGCPICATTSLHGLPVPLSYTKTFAISPGQAGRARGFQPPRANTILSPVSRLAKIDSCPLKRSFSYLILTVALRDRPPAPTRRTPRRIAKRRIDKAARRDNGRPFRVAVPSKLPIPVCVGARPVQLLDERSSAIKLSKIPRRGARPPGRSVPVRDYNPSDRDRSIWRKYKSPARRAWARRAYAKLHKRPRCGKPSCKFLATLGTRLPHRVKCAGRAAVPPAADVRP
jgi:hypothetical protein